MFFSQRDMPGLDNRTQCDALGDRTLADVAELCRAAAPDCAAFTHFSDEWGTPQFCLVRAASPLKDPAPLQMPDFCMGTFIHIPRGEPGECGQRGHTPAWGCSAHSLAALDVDARPPTARKRHTDSIALPCVQGLSWS